MKRNIKTLVIHPSDPSTDFLNVIYADLECTVIRQNISDNELRNLIKSHDRIIMLGHGFHHGLFGHGRIIINATHVELLRTKKLVGIWCFANHFFEPNNLQGIYSDMIISEMMEAMAFGVDCTYEEVNQSNLQFAIAVRDAIIADFPVETFKDKYRSDENPVIHWNQDNFYHAYQMIQI